MFIALRLPVFNKILRGRQAGHQGLPRYTVATAGHM